MKDCNSCGKCCIKYSNGNLSASVDDVAHWENSRPDIHEYVHNGHIWFEPNSDKLIELCPWLRQAPDQRSYSCAIYYDRPEDCRIYPATVNDMLQDSCEMLEPKDLNDLKQAELELRKYAES